MNNTIKLTLLLILMCSCQKIQNDGGLLSRDVYILENGKLVDAQNYEKTIPQEGSIFNIEFVTFGITNIENKKRADGIVMTTDVSPVPDEDDLYDIVDEDTEWPRKRYCQTVTVAAEPNGGKERIAVYTVISSAWDGYFADITVEQLALEQ